MRRRPLGRDFSRTPIASSQSARPRRTTWRRPRASYAAHVRFARGDVEARSRRLGAGHCARPRDGDSGETSAGASRARPRARVARAPDEARVLVAEGMGSPRRIPPSATARRIVADQARRSASHRRSSRSSSWHPTARGRTRPSRTPAVSAHARRTCTSASASLSIAADVRFGAAEALLEEGRTAEGLAELDKALAFFRPVGATFFLERGEAARRRGKDGVMAEPRRSGRS